jgi:CheY-like chemotaxis protein
MVNASGVILLKKYQTKLEEAVARAEAECGDRAECQFLTGVSREIRTLNGIVGINELSPWADPTKQQRRYAALIEASCKSVLSLIDVLRLETTESGEAKFKPRPSIPDPCAARPRHDSAAVSSDVNEACIYQVLLAEVDPINVTLTSAILNVAGCKTDHVMNGRQALAKLERADFDLIIMDSQMPELDGTEATKWIRSRSDWKSSIPILLLTADATNGAEEEYLSAGASLYMTRPFKVSYFIATVACLAQYGRGIRGNRVVDGSQNGTVSWGRLLATKARDG